MRTSVTILGGYLGTGKTTLVNKILKDNTGKKIAILVNEFGNLPIDEDLIESRDENLISLAGGCICCSYGDALTETLSSLGNNNKDIDHIVIETSGVAIPSTVAGSISLIPSLRVTGIIITIDTDTFLSLKDDQYLSDTVARQLISADLIIMNKIDLVSESRICITKNSILDINTKAEIVSCTFGNVKSDLIFKDFDPRNQHENIVAVHNPEDLYSSFYYKSIKQFNLDKLAVFLTHQSNHIIRAKGFLYGQDNVAHIIQSVGRKSNISKATYVKEFGIVVIGLKSRMNRKNIEAQLEKFTCD